MSHNLLVVTLGSAETLGSSKAYLWPSFCPAHFS